MSQLTLSHPERIVEHGLVLQNAIYRLARVTPAWTRCLILLLRYTAISDDKRTGIIKFGLNLANGSALDPFVDDVFTAALSVESAAGASVPPDAPLPPDWPAPACTPWSHALCPPAGAFASLSPGYATALGARPGARACLLHGLRQEAWQRLHKQHTDARERLRLEAAARSIRRRWLTYARNTICASPSSWSKLSSSQALCSASN